MARRRFFVDAVHGSSAVLEGADARHLGQVLRAEPGQIYELSDNRSVYLAEVEAVRKGSVRFRVIEELAGAPPPVHIALLLSLIKFDRFEWAVEKATELGVETIVPVEAERSEQGLRLAASKRLERWRKIVRESSRQARRARLPEVLPVVAFDEAIHGAASFSYFLDERPGAPALFRVLPEVRRPEDTVRVLVGPEGGWTEVERLRACAAGWSRVSLGPNILRAETAAIAVLAVLAAAWHRPASVDSLLSRPLS
jgi:16S rRNA (uracil1498-N3)-methyltransferase